MAQETLTISDLMIDREKIKTEEIIANGGEVRIIDIDPVTLSKPNGQTDDTWVYITKEYPDNFVFAGVLLKKIFDKYLKQYEGDVGALRDDFTKAGGIKIRLTAGETKGSGRDLTLVEVL